MSDYFMPDVDFRTVEADKFCEGVRPDELDTQRIVDAYVNTVPRDKQHPVTDMSNLEMLVALMHYRYEKERS